MRFDLSDEEWALLVPLLPKNRKSARVDAGTLRALHNSLQSVQPLVSPGHLEAHRRRVGIEISRQLVSDRQHDRESPPLSQRRKRGGEKSGDRHQPGGSPRAKTTHLVQESTGANSRNRGNRVGVAHHFLLSLRGLPQAPVARILPKIPVPADLIEYEEAYCRDCLGGPCRGRQASRP